MHAELRVEGGEMHFHQLGASFSFVNELPVHVRSAGRPSSTRVFDGDTLRLGGNLDGKPHSGLRRFMFRLDAPSLGKRPTETVPPSAAAAAPAEGDDRRSHPGPLRENVTICIM